MLIVNDQFLKTLLESISEGILVINDSFEIVYVNDAITDLFDYASDELIGRNLDVLIPLDLKTLHEKHLRGYIKNSSTKIMSQRDVIFGLRKDGSTLGLDIGLNHFESNGEKYMIAIISDISQTRITNRFLRDLHAVTSDPQKKIEEKITELLRLGCKKFHLPIGILSKVCGDDYSIVFIHANTDEKQRMLSQQPCKLDHTYCHDVIEAEEPIYLKQISKSKKKSHPCFKKTGLETYMGAKVIVENKTYGTLNFCNQKVSDVSISHTDLQILKLIAQWIGNMIQRENLLNKLNDFNSHLEVKIESRTQELRHALIEIQEINQSLKGEVERRIEAEEQAKASLEKEVKLNELKSRFVSTASHEFRTPLTGILSAANLIDRYAASGMEEKRKKHINIIKSSVKNLTNILNDFLSLSKLESGIIEADVESFELNQFLNGIIEDMTPTLKRDQIINFIPLYEGHKDVCQDSKLLKNVMINLLSNASKYSSEDKPIDIKCEHIEDNITISILDKGIGIPKVDQLHLFDRFFRAGNASAYQGTGLGLNITSKYVKLMHGTISYESVENEGSNFSVTFPRNLK